MADPARKLELEGKSDEVVTEEETLDPAEIAEYHELKKNRHRGGTHEEESSWLVSYADMMTLLVGFFVMLQSFSKVDSSTFEKVKRETTKVFGGEYKIPFEKLSQNLKQVVGNAKLQDQVLFQETDQGLDITFRGALFFDSGGTSLRDQAKVLLAQLIPTISTQAKDFGILVEGHTDNVRVHSADGALVSSNWELSSLRACTVLKLFEERGFDRKKIKAVGWGDTKPILPNEDQAGIAIPENQSQNRRVVIKILKQFE